MQIKSIKSAKNLKNKRVLMRCDFDIPLKLRGTMQNKKTAELRGKILDDTRLKACLPTIKYLLKKKASVKSLRGHGAGKIILMGHLGRPGGKVDKKLSLMPVKKWLEKELFKNQELRIKNQGIYFIKDLNKFNGDCFDYEICLLENLRFNSGEEKNDRKFAKNLAKLGDIYVNNAFAVSHRSAASIDAIQDYLPSFAGLRLEQEVKNLNYILDKPKRPLVVVIGGAKIGTKLPIIKQFINQADYILIGGAVANVFFKAQGYEVGKSVVDNKYLGEAKNVLKPQITNHKLQTTNYKPQITNKKKYPLSPLGASCQLLLPLDVVVTGGKNKTLTEVGKNEMILDIGLKTRILFSGIIKSARTIVWNGPMGNFENKKFMAGTQALVNAILEHKKAKAVVGGGESIQAIVKLPNCQIVELPKNIFVSTGGGAMLEYLSGSKLPGLKKIL